MEPGTRLSVSTTGEAWSPADETAPALPPSSAVASNLFVMRWGPPEATWFARPLTSSWKTDRPPRCSVPSVTEYALPLASEGHVP